MWTQLDVDVDTIGTTATQQRGVLILRKTCHIVNAYTSQAYTFDMTNTSSFIESV